MNARSEIAVLGATGRAAESARRSAAEEVDIFSPTRPPAKPELIDAERFQSPAVFEAEMTKLWGRVWQIACLLSEIPNVDDYHEYQVGSWSFLIVRSGAGPEEVQAYHNVCHHRGRKIKTGSGNASSLMCIYHGCTWTLTGEVEHIPERQAFCPFADEEVQLTPVGVAVYQDFVFINPDLDAPPFDKHLAGMAEAIEPYRYDRMYRWRSMTTTLRGNWKNVVDAFTENYHARTEKLGGGDRARPRCCSPPPAARPGSRAPSRSTTCRRESARSWSRRTAETPNTPPGTSTSSRVPRPSCRSVATAGRSGLGTPTPTPTPRRGRGCGRS